MSFEIVIEPAGYQFTAEANQTILDAALAAGYALPYSCRDGVCGVCQGHVIEGEVSVPSSDSPALLTADDVARGQVLFCQCHPQSNLRIEAPEAKQITDTPIKRLPCRLQHKTLPAADVAILTFKLPAKENFHFRAGQYIDFLLADGRRRSFSLANAPEKSGLIELHIRHIKGGFFTHQVFNTLKEREILRFEGPLGTFSLDENSPRKRILLAGGTGFAPIKSIVEHMIAQHDNTPTHLYWGARTPADLYLHELAQYWADQHTFFSYTPVLSEAPPQWQGRCGLVHQAVMADSPDLSEYDIYACGSPAMIAAASSDFIRQCRLPDNQFFADAFTFSSDSGS